VHPHTPSAERQGDPAGPDAQLQCGALSDQLGLRVSGDGAARGVIGGGRLGVRVVGPSGGCSLVTGRGGVQAGEGAGELAGHLGGDRLAVDLTELIPAQGGVHRGDDGEQRLHRRQLTLAGAEHEVHQAVHQLLPAATPVAELGLQRVDMGRQGSVERLRLRRGAHHGHHRQAQRAVLLERDPAPLQRLRQVPRGVPGVQLGHHPAHPVPECRWGGDPVAGPHPVQQLGLHPSPRPVVGDGGDALPQAPQVPPVQ